MSTWHGTLIAHSVDAEVKRFDVPMIGCALDGSTWAVKGGAIGDCGQALERLSSASERRGLPSRVQWVAPSKGGEPLERWVAAWAAASQGTLTVLPHRPVRRVVARSGGEVAGRCVRHVDYHLACRVNVWGVGVTKSGRPWPCRTATPRLLLGPSSAAPLGPPPRS